MENSTRPAPRQGAHLETRTFISTVCILLAVMITAGLLTQFLPQGSFARETNETGQEIIVENSFEYTQNAERLPVYRWFTAPFEVFGSENGMMAVGIIIFLVFIGGTFLILDKSGVMQYYICRTVKTFKGRKYTLMAMIILVSMLLGSAAGLFEESAVLVPLMVAVALSFGWDSLVGLGISVLAFGFGFAAGTLNPFSIAVAQRLAGLEIYSGLPVRIGIFAVVYAMLLVYMLVYAKRIEKHPEKSICFESDKELRLKYRYDNDDIILSNMSTKKAARIFLCAFFICVAYIAVSLVVDGLSDYTMVVMPVVFAIGGLAAGKAANYDTKSVGRDFLKGMLSIAPCSLLVVMAMSAKQIVEAGGVMDTILYKAYLMLEGINPYIAIICIYIFVLVLEFFISSASAKAFIVIPLIVPLAQMLSTPGLEIGRQTIVQAYCFGDGFTNMFMPTNAMLFIVLGLVNLSYGKWVRWSWPLQLIAFIITSGILLLCLRIGF